MADWPESDLCFFVFLSNAALVPAKRKAPEGIPPGTGTCQACGTVKRAGLEPCNNKKTGFEQCMSQLIKGTKRPAPGFPKQRRKEKDRGPGSKDDALFKAYHEAEVRRGAAGGAEQQAAGVGDVGGAAAAAAAV